MTRPDPTTKQRNGKVAGTFLPFTQLLEVNKRLEDLIIPGPNGRCTYQPGHTDLTVADSMPFPCSSSTVSRLRMERWGTVRAASEPRSPSGSAARIEALEARVEALSRRIADVERHQEGNEP